MNEELLLKYVEKEIEKYLAEKDKDYIKFLSSNNPSDFPELVPPRLRVV